jgi:CHAT domain-containing protein/TolA-binding protein
LRYALRFTHYVLRGEAMKSKVFSRWLLSGVAALSPYLGSEMARAPIASAAQETPVQQTQNLDKARELIKDGKYAKAETLARELLKQVEATPDTDSLKVAEVLDLLVEALYRGGKANAPESRRFAERAVAIKEKAFGPDHPEVAISLNHLANLLYYAEDYARAKPLYERALMIGEKTLGPEHLEVAKSLTGLAALRSRAGEHNWAKPLYERALAIREKILGPEHPEVARNLRALASQRHDTGDYAGAKPLYERALAIQEKALGPDHPDLATILNPLGDQHRHLEDYAKARALHERALAIQEKALGPDHIDVANTLHDLAHLLHTTKDYAGERPLLERTLAIQEKALGPDHREVAHTLSDLTRLLRTTGDYTGARPFLERALTIHEKVFGPEHVEVAHDLNGLANLLADLGDHAGAKPLYERSLAIYEKTRGPEHPDVALVLNNLAQLLRYHGDYAEAERLCKRALTIQEKALGPDDEQMAGTLFNLAELLRETHDYARAKPLYERALAIQEEAFGPEHPKHNRVAETLNHLAELHTETGDYNMARPLFERSLAIFEKTFGPNHTKVARSLNYLANVLRDVGDYAGAKPLYERALVICEKALGPDHPDVAEILSNFAQLLAKMGDNVGAFQIALRAEQISRDHLRLTARSLPERQALGYASVRTTGLNLALSLTANESSEFKQQVWNALLRSRALVLDEMAARHSAVGGIDDPEIARLHQALVSAQQRLANLVVRGSSEGHPDHYRRLLDEARKEKEHAERALAEKSAEFRQEQAKSQIGFAEAAAALAPNCALVAFARYYHHKIPAFADSNATAPSKKSEPLPSYLAFVLRSGENEPTVIPLGTAKEIEALVSRWREEAARGAMIAQSPKQTEAAYRKAGEALRLKVWDPVALHLQAATQIFVVPDGVLNLVNLAALPVGQSDYLVESRPLIHYLSAERDLVPSEAPEIKGEGLLALGGPAFNEKTLFSALARKDRIAATRSQAQTGTSQTYRGARSNCSDFQSMRFEPLPASAREVKEIVSLWASDSVAQQNAAAVINLTGAKATETAFKEQALGRRVLHLATHGFFLGGRCSSALQSLRGVGGVKKVESSEPAPQIISDNPLLLSGLALAGANHRAKAGPEEDDGILTAEEIAAMNLSGVEWAVLSACETGVGKVEAGEGVFGLRRAFQMAGAGTLIMSLWSVEDESARQWMRALYEGRLVKKLSTAESVRAASLEVLRSRREKGQSTHPFFWAGFVAAGDWR